VAVPDSRAFMLPLLKSLADGEVLTLQESIEQMAVEFNLTPEDRRENLTSGAPEPNNRVTRIGSSKQLRKTSGYETEQVGEVYGYSWRESLSKGGVQTRDA